MGNIHIHTDGSIANVGRAEDGTPTGDGGWAAVIYTQANEVLTISGSKANTTTPRMELTAVIMALYILRNFEHSDVVLYTDHKLIADAVNDYRDAWEARKKMTGHLCGANGEPVANEDLWLRLFRLVDKTKPTILWIKRDLNEEADALANAAKNAGIALRGG